MSVVLLSSLWPPNPDNPHDVERGFSHECPFTLDEFLQKRNALLLPAFERVPPMPGAERLVQHLAKHQIPICVRNYHSRLGCDGQSQNQLFVPCY